MIRSLGKDRVAGVGGIVAGTGGTTSFDNDLIVRTGSFVQFPAGTMR